MLRFSGMKESDCSENSTDDRSILARSDTRKKHANASNVANFVASHEFDTSDGFLIRSKTTSGSQVCEYLARGGLAQ